MNRAALFVLPLLFLACKKEPDATQAAVHVKVDLNFRAGCIVVDVMDAANEANTDREEVVVRDPAKRQAHVAVFRREDWGRTLKITTTARERTPEETCTGVELDSQVDEVTLNEPGTQTVEVRLESVDEDGDGYVPTANGGTDCNDRDATVIQLLYYLDGDGDDVGAGTPVRCTPPSAGYVTRSGDCDDTRPTVRPGQAEVCDNLDNDCQNGADDGLARADYFLDEDRDGVGTGPAVNACAQPANHATQGGDCNDGDSAIRPGLNEVCDEKDNDCRDGVDNGLATTRYYLDEDGDTYGLESSFRDSCRPSLTRYVTRAGDCNDSSNAVRPDATETCNEIDDNCAGGADEGFNKVWYRDVDNDGFGVQSNQMTGCVRPAGYVAPRGPFDCNDSVTAVNPDAQELCNEIDDNCVNGTDETFMSGAMGKDRPCSEPCPGGRYVCRSDGAGTRCESDQPTDYFTDQDGDGAGMENATAQPVCPTQPAPDNTAPNRDDCDDRDKHNRRNVSEVCDDRDNNCGGGVDEGNVCNGADWGELSEPALTGKTWNTVAVNPASTDGYPVWTAGGGGVLARRSTETGTFTSFDGECGNTDWNAAWVRRDGRVYLAGSGGRVAEFDGTTCTTFTTPSTQHATGIVGFETGTPPTTTVLLYVVDVSGGLFSWRPQSTAPGNQPQPVEALSASYHGVHGFDASRLIVTGQTSGGGNGPLIRSYSGGTSTSSQNYQDFGNNLRIRAVWMGALDFAYAVGDGNIILRWNGASDWTTVTPPGVVNFTSVCAPDPSSGYTTDTAGNIRRYKGITGSGAWETHYTAGGELRDIALSSPGNVWAVGPAGRVVHFPHR